VARERSIPMLLVALLSLLIGVLGLMGSVSMISDGLGLTQVGSATSGPNVGTTSAPPPSDASTRTRVVLFGTLRLLLSLALAIGAVGTMSVTPTGRRASLIYAAGWIAVGAIEPWALRYRFGWEVLASAAYPFLLLALFNSPGWRTAFAHAPAAAAPEPEPR